MKTKVLIGLAVVLIFTRCKNENKSDQPSDSSYDFSIALGSCNNVNLPNHLWDDIRALSPDVFVWGGDIVYADGGDMTTLELQYQQQNAQEAYQQLKQHTDIIGTWDDHDYGLNDGGVEFEDKQESQQLFLDFLGVASDDQRRTREGVYTSKTYAVKNQKIKVIILDTRYFRSPLTTDPSGEKRYIPNNYGEGTMLGDAQWNWLEEELLEQDIDYNVIISSIQFLSSLHGFESWGTMPHEVDKLLGLLKSSHASNVMLVSGDRHISEFSKLNDTELPYPLIDFTTSGLTHSYAAFEGEENPYRVAEVVADKSFGLLRFDLNSHLVSFSMHTDKIPFKQELLIKYN